MALSAAAAMALVAACGNGDSEDPLAGTDDDATETDDTTDTDSETDNAGESGDAVTLTWWHNSNNEPGQGFYEEVAADFEAMHEGVTIEIEAMEHTDMVDRLAVSWQTGDNPDVFMERGGGEMAAKVEAGLIKDLTDLAPDTIDTISATAAAYELDGRTYALPFSIGLVGFWYNTDLFDEAGVEPPTTMDELYDVIDRLKAADIEPISVGAQDGWPAAHYWYYFAVRQCSVEALETATVDMDLSDECFTRAGEDLQALIDVEPFNTGFLGTPAQAGPTSASGLLAAEEVAMELAGHWEPGVLQGLTEDGEGLDGRLGWFPFPAVDGADGDPEAQMGGGDAWACAENAPDICVDFIEHLLSDEVQQGFAKNDMGLPTNPSATEYVADESMAQLLEYRDTAPYVQLYLDTLLGEAVGGEMNDAIVRMFGGQASPEDIVNAIESAG